MDEKKKLSLWFEKPIGGLKNIFKREMKEVELPKMGIQVNLIDSGNELIAKVFVRGFNKEDIKLKATSKTLDISAEKTVKSVDQKKGFYKEEMSAGAERKMITLPVEIDPNKVSAKYEDEILNIIMQKKVKTIRR